MPAPVLDIPVFDADNHLYETQDALTKFLPDRYRGAIDYVDVRGRTKIVVCGRISEYIPNPTFEAWRGPARRRTTSATATPRARAGGRSSGNRCGRSRVPRAAPRVVLMDEQGIDRALMFPTLASLVEERLRDDVELTHAAIHALNQWMHETWTFNYEDRIFVPVITLPIVERAIEELEWVGAAPRRAHPARPGPRLPRAAIVRAAGVRPLLAPGRRGRRPRRHALLGQRLRALHQRVDGQRQRDAAVPAAGVPDARPVAADRGRRVGRDLPRGPVPLPEVEGRGHRERQQLGGAAPAQPRRRLQEDAAGLPRGPDRGLPAQHPHQPLLGGGPGRARRLIGDERVLFGSDYPHPEGLAEPATYVHQLAGVPTRPSARSWAATSPGS